MDPLPPKFKFKYSKSKSLNKTMSTKDKLKKKVCYGSTKICQGMNEYFELSTIHGLKYIIERYRSKFEKFLWGLLVLTVSAITIWLVLFMYSNFLDAPTATTQMPTRKSVTTVPFPSIGICDGNRISQAAAEKFAKHLYAQQNNTYLKMGTYDLLLDYVIRFGTLYSITTHTFNFNDLDRFHSFLLEVYKGNYSIGDLIDSLHYSCYANIRNCKWQGQEVDCKKVFTERKTHIGLCCLFNYQRLKQVQAQELKKRGIPIPAAVPVYVHGPGVEMGLSVVIEHRTDDYSFFLNSNLASYIYVFEPLDFADQKTGSIAERIINPGQELFLSLHPQPVVGTESMRQVPKTSRGCLFDDEMLSETADGLYSFNECYLSCQVDDLIKFCQCYPFYIPSVNTSTECLLPDIACLQKWNLKWANVEDEKVKEKKQTVSLQCQHCLPRCNYINYKIQASYGYIEARTKSTNKMTLNLTKSTSVLHVYYGDAYVVEFQQTIVNTWDEMLSMFGGLFSLMLGASIISGAEYIYYQTGKCFSIFYGKNKDVNSNKQPSATESIRLEKEYQKIKKRYWKEIQLQRFSRIPKLVKKK